MKGVVTAMAQHTQYMTYDLYAPIIPDVGLGGLRLREPITAITPLIDHLPNRYTNADWCRLVPPWEARYLLGPISVSADVRTGHIFKISAYEGYKGLLFDKVGTGMAVADAIRSEPRLRYNEGSEVLEIMGVQGVALDVPIEDPDPAEVYSLSICAISVYAAEISDYW